MEEKAYRCGVTAEVRRVFSGQVRLLQRPELVKTRRSAAAAVELERQCSSERRKMTKI